MPDVRPVFSGGTGRSGTTVLAKLLRSHPHVRASRPLEVRCVTDSAGLLDLCVGPGVDAPWQVRTLQVLPAGLEWEFGRRMRTRWWRRTNRLGYESGLHRGMTEGQRDALVSGLRSTVRTEPLRAGREFLSELMVAQGVTVERWWIDTSPPNIAHSDRIAKLAPDAVFVHMVRDGRDSAASVMAETWGPSVPVSAVDWWAARLRRAHRALQQVPPERVLTLALEDLVVFERERSYGALLDFLDLPDRPRMRRYFSDRMPPERVKPGNWRSRVADPGALERAYERARDRLIGEGIEVHAAH